MAGLPRRQGLGRGCDGTEVQAHGHKDGCRTACTRSWEGRCGVGAFRFPPSRTRLVLGEQRSTARHGSWTAAGKPHLRCREPREGSTSRKKESEQLRSGQDEAGELTSVPVRDQASLAWKDTVSVARQEESRHERPQARWKVGQGARSESRDDFRKVLPGKEERSARCGALG